MIDSDSNDTAILEEVLPLLFVVCTLSRTLTTEVDEDMEIPCKSRGNGTHNDERKDPSNKVVYGAYENEDLCHIR